MEGGTGLGAGGFRTTLATGSNVYPVGSFALIESADHCSCRADLTNTSNVSSKSASPGWRIPSIVVATTMSRRIPSADTHKPGSAGGFGGSLGGMDWGFPASHPPAAEG